jgi:hypothetical protein
MHARLDFELAAEFAMTFGVISLIDKHSPEPRHHGRGAQEQPLEREHVANVRRRCRAGDRHTVASDGQ